MLERLKLEEGWTTLLLVWSLIAVTATAIAAAELTDEGLDILMSVGTVGVLVGLLLAKSRFSSRTAHFFSLVYGVFLVGLLVGSLLPADLPWRLRIFDLVERQVTWMGKAVGGGISRDNIIFVLQTSAIFWLLGYTASWYTFRTSRVWRVVLPTGLVLLSVIYYYYGPKPLVIFLGVYALLALLYVARTHLVDQEKGWRSASVRYEGEIHFDFLRASFIVGIVVLLLAGSLPALGASNQVSGALADVGGPWRQFQDSWTRLFASLRSYGAPTSDAYEDTMVLGGPRTVGNRLVMDVYVPEPLSSVYWQGVVLDTYDGDGEWSNNTEQTLMHFPDEGAIGLPDMAARRPLTQTIVNYNANSSTMYGAPQIVTSDRQLLLDLSLEDSGEAMSVNWIRSRYILRQGDSYGVISHVSYADKTSLRNASTAYPQWIQDHYLQLPDTITPETKDLASQLTGQYDNPFDKAIALRDYLRQEIAYNDQIQAPPEGVEPVHYILFEGQEAYCTYYASAMSVMLRSLGIPSRIVNGYAQGEWLEDTGNYRVRSSNAHTWVEVYFPEYGWIQFEPTASIPTIERMEGPSGNSGDAFPFLGDEEPFPLDNLPEEAGDVAGGDLNDQLAALLAEEAEAEAAAAAEQRRQRIVRFFGGSLLLVVAGGLIFTANHYNRQVESSVEKSYDRLSSWGRWLGVLFRPVDTPYERADRLTQMVPEGRTPIRNLTYQYVLRRFSPSREGDREFDTTEEWRSLRPLLLRKSIAQYLKRLRRRA